MLTSIPDQIITGNDMVSLAKRVIENEAESAKNEGIEMKVDAIQVFDKGSFRELGERQVKGEVVICGAMWLGKTRLIDNLLINWKI